MKKAIILAAIFVITWGVYKFQNPSPKEKIRTQLEEALDIAEVEDQLPPVQAAMHTKNLLEFLDQDFSVTFTINKQERTIDDRDEIKTGLIAGLRRLRDFEFELLKNQVKVEGPKAVMQAKIRGRGEIINYMKRFSEVHRFKISFFKKSGEWKMTKVEHIPYPTP